MLRRVGRRRRHGWALGAALLFLAGGGSAVRSEGEAGSASQTTSEPSAELDRLLKLPAGQSYGVERRGGLSRGEWRTRFAEVQDALASERRGLTEAESKLDETAGSASNWQVAPVPGLQPSPDAPLDYQLRVAIRRHKSEIERLEHKLKQLEIEANLAGVPPEWRS